MGITGGTIPANGTCTVLIGVTGSVPGVYPNTIAANALSAGGVTNNAAANGNLTILAPLNVTKSFSPANVPAGTQTTLSITIANNNSTPLTNLAFADTYPANMINFTPFLGSNTCGGALNGTAGGNSISISGASLGANQSCTVTVQVLSNVGGSYLNTIPIGAVTSDQTASTVAASATLDVLTVGVTKSFTPTAIPVNGTSTLTFILSNSSSAAILGAAFTDNYPAFMINAPSPNVINTCSGSVTANANANSVSLPRQQRRGQSDACLCVSHRATGRVGVEALQPRHRHDQYPVEAVGRDQ